MSLINEKPCDNHTEMDLTDYDADSDFNDRVDSIINSTHSESDKSSGGSSTGTTHHDTSPEKLVITR